MHVIMYLCANFSWLITRFNVTRLFDMTISSEDAGKEIVKCMNMAKDGIHAVLMVFSATSRFSREDSSTIDTIKIFFGEKIIDHMILVFTYGDLVGESKLKSMLNNAPEYLQVTFFSLLLILCRAFLI
jgi:hypothetical protein